MCKINKLYNMMHIKINIRFNYISTSIMRIAVKENAVATAKVVRNKKY